LMWCVGLLLPAMFLGCVLGQKGSLWLLVVSASAYLLKQQRPAAAGCVVALLTLKPTLCALLPLAMLLTGQWRFCFGFAATTIAIYGGCALCLPYSMWTDYLEVVRGAAEYQANAGYRSGWSTGLMTLLTSVGTPKLISLAVLGGSLLALMGRCIVIARSSSDRNPMMQADCLWLLLIGTGLLSPHAYFYDLTWLMLPLGGMLSTQPRRAMRNLSMLWIGMLLGQAFETGPAFPAMALLAIVLSDTRLSDPKSQPHA
jgi:alpha-1,2-mannosyltransferase